MRRGQTLFTYLHLAASRACTEALLASGITSIAQLNGKTVATTTGTTSVQVLRKNEKATGIDFKELYGKDHADSFLLLESGRADIVIGSRYVRGSKILGWGPLRYINSHVANRLARLVTGVPANDATNGLRLFRRQVLEHSRPALFSESRF